MDNAPDRKSDAAAADDPSEFRITEFGRQRVTRIPRPLRALARLIAWPFRFVHNLFRKPRLSDSRP